MDDLRPLADGMVFTECPRWHDGRLWFSDELGERVLAVSLDGTVETVAEVPGMPAGLGFLPDGRLLIVSMGDRRLLCREHDGELREHADLSVLSPTILNEMVVDASGRAYVGNAGFDFTGGEAVRPGYLMRVDPDGTATIVAEDLYLPNGAVITPDGRTLVVAETVASRLTAFAIRDDGSLGDRRTWAAFGEPPATTDLLTALEQCEVLPDGICLDAEGAIWIADPPRQRLLRVAEGGAILEERSGPMQLFACMLGGDDRQTLFVCAAPAFEKPASPSDYRSGILIGRVQVPGTGLP
jgi:sugar lactone lactonase YvrE